MKNGNVLVIGNSGVGKSTLINAVLGKECAKTGWGGNGTTGKLEIYGDENDPFRIIDTIGFEPGFFKEWKAIDAVKKWSEESAKKGKDDTAIHAIWFCVDGTSSKLFEKTIQNLSRATKMWKTVPIIVVITKSYSVLEREKNIEMVQNAFAMQKRYSKNLKKIIPVVAQTYHINESAYAAPEGISELIDITNDLLPEGIKASYNDIAEFKLNRKRALSQSVVMASATAGVGIAAVPLPDSITDGTLLAPLETLMVNGIAKIYDVKDAEGSKRLVGELIKNGAIGVAAKKAISILADRIPVAGQVLNALVAGSIIITLGETSIYAFEQIYLGKKSIDDLDWLTQVMESEFASKVLALTKTLSKNITKDTDIKQVVELVSKAISEAFSKKSK